MKMHNDMEGPELILSEPDKIDLPQPASTHVINKLTDKSIAMAASYNNLIASSKQMTTNRDDQVSNKDENMSGYEILSLRFEDIIVEHVKAVSDSIYLNATCR